MPPSSSPPSTSPTAPSAPLQSSCVQTCSLCVLVWRLPLVLFSPSAPFVPVKSDGVRTLKVSASTSSPSLHLPRDSLGPIAQMLLWPSPAALVLAEAPSIPRRYSPSFPPQVNNCACYITRRLQ